MNAMRAGLRGARLAVRPAALGYALATLLAALFMCLTTVGHHDDAVVPDAATRTAHVVPGAAEAGPPGPGSPVAASGHCPSEGTCCDRTRYRAAAVITTYDTPSPVFRLQQPERPAVLVRPPPGGQEAGHLAPDLSVLQVRRT